MQAEDENLRKPSKKTNELASEETESQQVEHQESNGPRDQPIQRSDELLRNLDPFTGFVPRFGQQLDGDNLFPLNFGDLPLLSDFSQTQTLPQDSMFDVSGGWINTASLLGSAGANYTTQVDPVGNAATIADSSFGNGFGYSTDLQGHAPIQTPTWSMETQSPTNTMGVGMNGDVRNAQREALLSAVDRLMQLASLMQ